MTSWTAIDEAIDRKRLWRALIDNVCADSARLSDNELVAVMMILQGFTIGQIGRVLENHQRTGYLTRTRAQQLVQSGFKKALGAGGVHRRVELTPARRQGRPRK